MISRIEPLVTWPPFLSPIHNWRFSVVGLAKGRGEFTNVPTQRGDDRRCVLAGHFDQHGKTRVAFHQCGDVVSQTDTRSNVSKPLRIPRGQIPQALFGSIPLLLTLR
jgi:YD repeat-containing protein